MLGVKTGDAKVDEAGDQQAAAGIESFIRLPRCESQHEFLIEGSPQHEYL